MEKNSMELNLENDIILKLDREKKSIVFYTNMDDEEAINILFATILIIARSSSSNDNSLN